MSDVQIAGLKGWRFGVFLFVVYVLSPIFYYSPKVIFRGVYLRLLEREQEAKIYFDLCVANQERAEARYQQLLDRIPDEFLTDDERFRRRLNAKLAQEGGRN